MFLYSKLTNGIRNPKVPKSTMVTSCPGSCTKKMIVNHRETSLAREEMHEIRTPKKMTLVGLKICALALFLLLGAAAEDERKPNIIFMLMDDVS